VDTITYVRNSLLVSWKLDELGYELHAMTNYLWLVSP